MPDNTKERKRLLADGPRMLNELNPKGAAYFADRVCATCDGPIMTHWLIPSADPDLRGEYFCDPEGKQFSAGLKV